VGQVPAQFSAVHRYVKRRLGCCRALLTPSPGNLPTEKVTKRDLFHVFYRHGKLAQISIKQAYGFVQFLDAESCMRALQQAQGLSVRGRPLRKPLFLQLPPQLSLTIQISRFLSPSAIRVAETVVATVVDPGHLITAAVVAIPIATPAPPALLVREVESRDVDVMIIVHPVRHPLVVIVVVAAAEVLIATMVVAEAVRALHMAVDTVAQNLVVWMMTFHFPIAVPSRSPRFRFLSWKKLRGK
jgi:hypothetical protein